MLSLVPGPGNDQSVYFLWQIFGNIIYWVSGQETSESDLTIIHYVISAFNSGLLSLLLVIYALVIFIGTLNTAHQGEFLGRNWSSLWMPIRAIFGPLCVVPVKYGFCLAQVVLLYGVLVGVQLANYVWNSLETDLDGTAIPSVPVSLLNSVKENVGRAVLYRSVQKVSDSLGLKTTDLPSTRLKSSYACDEVQGANQFYNIGNTPTFCANSQSLIPTSLLPKLTSYTSQLCQPNKFDNFIAAMRWFYQDPYNDNGMTIKPAGVPGLSSGTLAQQCVDAVDSLLTGSSSSMEKVYNYNFSVAGKNQVIALKANLGDAYSHDNNENKERYVNAVGHIAFNFENQNYSSGKPSDYSKSADEFTRAIVNDLYKSDVKQAHSSLNDYLSELNKNLLNVAGDSTDRLVKNTNVPTDISVRQGTDIVTHSVNCNNYLINGNLSLRYLECLQLKDSGQTFSMYDVSNKDYPFENYIKSWWIGGGSYLAVDKIMNYNLEMVKNKLDQEISYPGMNIVSTVHYEIPLSVNYYPLIDGHPPRYQNSEGNTEYASDVKTTIVSANAGVTSVTNTIPDGLSMVSSSWASNVYHAVPACIEDSGSQACKDIITLQTQLINLPNEWRPPFIYLFNLVKSGSKSVIKSISDSPKDVTFLNNVFYFLKQNGIYQPTTTTAVPVYAVIGRIFDQVGGNGLSSDMTAVMNEFYNLGMPSSNLFSKIMQAQQVGADVVQAVIDSFTNIFENYQEQFKDIQSTAESMISDWSWGAGIAGALGGLFGAGSIGTAAAILGQTAVQLYMATQIGNLSMSLAWLPIALVVLGSLFTAAISFVVMMPLIPYFLFWAGTIVWALSILEGLVAAPLVALALVYPEGHEILGHGSPAIKIALNIIFRPVLMVIGVIAAMALTYVLITYSAQGFHLVAPLILNNFSASGMVNGIVSCFLIFIYASFMMMAFSKCFSVIYLIPDKVFDWIGASAGHRAGAEEVQQLQGKTEGMGSQAGQSMGSGVQQGIQAKQTETQSSVQAQSQDIQVAEKAGEAAGSEVRSAAEMAT
ncbi:DotA/TraY family protein [Piscirickettsia salmonis]|uniref:DotA/TraY family protein n=1 Tax=Piscirickettsia salmonis TaxID=1238 RepID=UPI0007C94F49|nr:hypothetical protein A0O36_01153 [Piscirickettsiaceae bacterium NZ-RLO1]